MVTLRQWLHRIIMPVLLTSCALVLPQDAAEAQPGEDTEQGVSKVKIVRPLAIETLDDLYFGAIISDAARDGTISVDPANGATQYFAGASASCGTSVDCGTHPALFAVTGESARSYRIFPPQSVKAYRTDGSGGWLDVTSLIPHSKNRGLADGYGLLDHNGSDMITLGGTVKIPAGTADGKYSAKILLVVMYD